MSRLARAILYSLIAAVLVGSGFPLEAYAACPQHQQEASCGCCPAEYAQSCEVRCQTASQPETRAVLSQEEDKPSRRTIQSGAAGALPLTHYPARVTLARIPFISDEHRTTPPRLYLQSHNLRL